MLIWLSTNKGDVTLYFILCYNLYISRVARTVFFGVPYHITQHETRRVDVFYSNEDKQIYLSWLKEYSQKHKLDIIAYCLMTNHIHLIVVPRTEDALQAVLKPLHMRYAQRLNREHGWKGRYFSSPLDEAYLWTAIRYVERYPVRAGIVRKCERYPWSSAAAHCHLREDELLSRKVA